jgi:hypothetical protein
MKYAESFMKRLRRSKDRKRSEKDLQRFVEDNKMEARTLLDKESQLYIAEDNKDTDGSMDSIRWREPIICTHT